MHGNEANSEFFGGLSPRTVTVRVVVYDYEGTTKIGEYACAYTWKINVGTPVVTTAVLSFVGKSVLLR